MSALNPSSFMDLTDSCEPHVSKVIVPNHRLQLLDILQFLRVETLHLARASVVGNDQTAGISGLRQVDVYLIEGREEDAFFYLSLIHISEPTRLGMISY